MRPVPDGDPVVQTSYLGLPVSAVGTLDERGSWAKTVACEAMRRRGLSTRVIVGALIRRAGYDRARGPLERSELQDERRSR